jgi:membrane associated rhomboid family serine protease
MGIYDRDYYRNEGPSFLDSLVPSGHVCRWLIGINIAVFVVQCLGGGPHSNFGLRDSSGIIHWLVLQPQAVLHGEVWRLLTYAFVHADFMHIFWNMLFLWWFGSDVEQLYGRKEFLAIYLVSAVLGGAAFEASALLIRGPNAMCVGASGAVTTLLFLNACHFPRRVILLFLFLPIPIWFFALYGLARDAYSFLTQTGNVAAEVHLAGAAFGLIYYQMQLNITDWFTGLMWWKHASRPRLKIFNPTREKEEPVAVSAASSSVVMDEHLEAKLDAVLEKIARTGKESLTEQEQRILQQAAEMYKRRRP